jgi:hypothetical protein
MLCYTEPASVMLVSVRYIAGPVRGAFFFRSARDLSFDDASHCVETLAGRLPKIQQADRFRQILIDQQRGNRCRMSPDFWPRPDVNPDISAWATSAA